MDEEVFIEPVKIKPITEHATTHVDETIAKYLINKTQNPTYEIHSIGSKNFIGTSGITIHKDKLIINGKKYTGTPGLMTLLTKKEIPQAIVTPEDYENYEEILVESGALYTDNDPSKNRTKHSRSAKYMTYIKPMWERHRPRSGSTPSIGSVYSPRSKIGFGIKQRRSKGSHMVGRCQTVDR